MSIALVGSTPPFIDSKLISYLDFDSYLTEPTIAWCQQAMIQLGHPQPISASEFFQVGRSDVVPDWYELLVHAARAHATSEAIPILELEPRPFVDFHQDLVEEMCQTIGLDPSQWPELRDPEA